MMKKMPLILSIVLSLFVVTSCKSTSTFKHDSVNFDLTSGTFWLKGLGLMMLAMLALAGCGINTIVANDSFDESQQDTLKTKITIPCKESSYDDAYYYRALGTSSSPDMRHVRSLAYRDAQQRLNSKIAEGEVSDFTFKANVICEEVLVSEYGTYEGYVVLEIAKDSIKYKQP